ncbi:FxsB family cyclophane-forming radical SAM/SPASM peptide maturase [Virgisporangium aurantiacum]|uniref:Radical SAM core domain-containing protein n=1 Tax=Virgisporangium aurantiacum TaxID=175570 RepID=A0A8J3YX63_9ACTN|nr:FxsB family cyclophane-forming radical SAM/SPASM peptide maturase [Virgisporangium aurantiacum]GIJ53309.1 hypothetical protein Vau01_008250 [Virgisporangium aurantiacum]
MTSVARARAVHDRAAPWPYRELDVPARIAAGWRPTPVRDVVLKVHQRCNLACDYCYVYTSPDQSWRRRPAAMPPDVRAAAVAALARHVRRHGLTAVRIVLHGGEPLLYRAERLAALADEVRAALPASCAVEIGVQTNGVLLDARALAVLADSGIAVGVSVDGSAADHDLHRPTKRGRGSFAAAARALELLRLPENRHSYAGVLCVADPGADPDATYDQLRALAPPAVDLLLPHANWQSPPRHPDRGHFTGSKTPYGDWLCAVFDRWYTDADPMRIRLFEDLLSLLLGGRSRSEQLGLSPSAVLVVESDGAIEQVDALKSAYEGACATGLDVRTHDLDDALRDPGVVARQIGLDALARECLDCELHRICGGGHYAHRFSPGSGFRNRSVYCADLQVLIEAARDRVEGELRRMSRA